MESSGSERTIAARAARQARAEAEARQAAEIRDRRTHQLELVTSVLPDLAHKLEQAIRTIQTCGDLTDHLEGFYEEIDKLTKGRTIFPVTELVVEQANFIVRDAKKLIEGDEHLDRVKEFVPAGDNPVYPDVLVTLRTVQQALGRFSGRMTSHKQVLNRLDQEARTICAAVNYYLTHDDEPSLEILNGKVEGEVATSWTTRGHGKNFFDFDRLDQCNLEKYFSGDEST